MRAKTAGVDRETNTYDQSVIVEIALRVPNEERKGTVKSVSGAPAAVAAPTCRVA